MTILKREDATFWYEVGPAGTPTVNPGSRVVFVTDDARAGAMRDQPTCRSFDLSERSPSGRSNPLSGPVAVAGAQPGDTLLVRIDDIITDEVGWAGAKRSLILDPGRIPRALARTCEVDSDLVRFSPEITVEARPMLGCIGTAPEGARIPSESPGPNGGNMDHKVITSGTVVHLPVSHEGAYLYIGDVHAAQGDGELSGVGMEIASTVTVTVDVVKSTGITWPWAEVDGRLMVMTHGANFPLARRRAIQCMLTAIEDQLGLEPAEALALLSIAGDLRIGQACGGMDMTVRLEVPASWGLRPA